MTGLRDPIVVPGVPPLCSENPRSASVRKLSLINERFIAAAMF
jgi:hypothetical protein